MPASRSPGEYSRDYQHRDPQAGSRRWLITAFLIYATIIVGTLGLSLMFPDAVPDAPQVGPRACADEARQIRGRDCQLESLSNERRAGGSALTGWGETPTAAITRQSRSRRPTGSAPPLPP